MLIIEVPSVEFYDEHTSRFVPRKGGTLQLEHSLLSLAKWESKWCVPFLTDKPLTPIQFIDYIRCMSIGQYDPMLYNNLSVENLETIKSYMNEPMTATTFPPTPASKKTKEILTAEVFYARMFSLGISIECQKWHLNRLVTLIHVCDVRNNPSKPMTKAEIMARNAQLNAARRAKHKTRG